MEEFCISKLEQILKTMVSFNNLMSQCLSNGSNDIDTFIILNARSLSTLTVILFLRQTIRCSFITWFLHCQLLRGNFVSNSLFCVNIKAKIIEKIKSHFFRVKLNVNYIMCLNNKDKQSQHCNHIK